MKKLIALLLALVMVVSMVACAKDTTTTEDTANTDATTDDAATTDDTATEDTGDTATTDDGATYHFEIVSKGFQSTYWQAVLKGSQTRIEELNTEAGYEKYTMNFVGPDSETDIAVQVQQMQSAINAKPNAIGLAALDVDAQLDNITAAQEAGIPIIGFDSGVPAAPEGSVYANASTDNYAAGGVAAEGMYKVISGRIGDGQVRIGVVGQDAVSESVVNRGLGFIDTMIDTLDAEGKTVYVTGNEKYVSDCAGSTAADEASADVIIEVRVPSQTTTEQCANEAGVILNEADTIAIFGSNQVAAEGIVTANETLQVCGSTEDSIIAVGFDSGSILKAAVSAGTMYGAVTQAPVSIGSVLIDLLAAVSAGEEVADQDTGCAFYTAENINDEEIAQNLYD